MEYLAHIDVRWPADCDATEWERVVALGRARARQLAAAGHIRRLWRTPRGRSNWGLWEAEDATSLHAALASLPLFPWLSIEVHARTAHPSDPGRSPGQKSADLG